MTCDIFCTYEQILILIEDPIKESKDEQRRKFTCTILKKIKNV